MKMKPGQVWRKQGPYDWLKIEHLLHDGWKRGDNANEL